jgi:Ca2+-binding RTX toxin-like protein
MARWLTAGAVAFCLFQSAPALAASARVDAVAGPQFATTLLLVYDADPGESNAVTVSLEPDGWYRVHDPGAAISAGTRCESAAGGDVRCFANTVEVRTGDMNDTVTGTDGAAIERISGGAGDDTLDVPKGDPLSDVTVMGGDGDDTLRTVDTGAVLEGGDGADDIHGGSGADLLDGGTGSDHISGGDGVDGIENNGRLDGVTVNLAEGYASAANGEHDELAADIENVRGGLGNDVLTGNDGPNVIGGGAGDDAVHGGGGDDTLTGDAGSDTLSGDRGNDTLFAGSDYSGDNAPNSLSGGSGRDALIGGPWRDVFDGGPGTDWMLGQGGHDVYEARDGEFDWVQCGSRNRGQVEVDVRDFVHGCGRVLRAGAARGVFVYGVLQPRQYQVGLACPADMPKPCEGTYRLVAAGRATRADSWRLRPGQSAESYYFVTKLTAAERRRLASAPSIVLRLVTRDARGRRVTASSPFPGPPVGGSPQYATGVDCSGCPPDG